MLYFCGSELLANRHGMDKVWIANAAFSFEFQTVPCDCRDVCMCLCVSACSSLSQAVMGVTVCCLCKLKRSRCDIIRFVRAWPSEITLTQPEQNQRASRAG